MSERADHAINMALEKLNERVIDMAEQKIIDVLDNCDFDHNKVFIRWAIGSAPRDLLTSILDEDTGIRDVFEAAVCQLVRTSSTAREIAKVLA